VIGMVGKTRTPMGLCLDFSIRSRNSLKHHRVTTITRLWPCHNA